MGQSGLSSQWQGKEVKAWCQLLRILSPGLFLLLSFLVIGVIFDGGLSAVNYRTRVAGSKAGLGQGCSGLVSCTGGGTQGRDLKPPTAQSLGFQTPSSMGSMGLINLYLASPTA